MKNKNTRSLKSLLEILIVSTKLGITSFGGPIAHLGYFHNEYIRKRKWMDTRSKNRCSCDCRSCDFRNGAKAHT